MRFLSSAMKIGLAFFLSLSLLSVFVLLFSFSGIHISNASGATDYKWSAKQWKSNMTEGFSWCRMDENGFNNLRASASVSPDILIMGSSHMEAVNVGKNENTAAHLSSLLPEFSIYNIGVSGHEIYQCAKNMRSAVTEYNPQKYVIVETATISLNTAKMERVLSDKLPTIPSYDSGFVYYVQKYSPAVKTIYKQVDNWKNAEKRKVTNAASESIDNDKDLLSRFLSKMRSDCGTERKLIIFYHATTEIDNDGSIVFSNSDSVELFATVCEENDIIFIDMTQPIEKLYKDQNILARGFVNTAVGEGHLNKYGHQVIAERLAEVIREDQQ